MNSITLMKNLRSRFALAVVSLILVSGAFAQLAPPKEEDKRKAHLIELISLDDTIKLDIRYATDNNFMVVFSRVGRGLPFFRRVFFRFGGTCSRFFRQTS